MVPVQRYTLVFLVEGEAVDLVSQFAREIEECLATWNERLCVFVHDGQATNCGWSVDRHLGFRVCQVLFRNEDCFATHDVSKLFVGLHSRANLIAKEVRCGVSMV